MADKYENAKLTFAGNKELIIGTLTNEGAVTSPVRGRGLISAGAMENQAESESHYADNEVWSTTKGSPLYTGSLTFIQLDADFRVDFFGQQEVSGKIGDISVKGFADTGNYPRRILQYLITGTATLEDGTVEDAALLMVLPNVQVTKSPTKESTTLTDGTEVTQWEAEIQATATDKFKFGGKSQAVYEFQIVGDDAVAKLNAELAKGTIALPDTVSSKTVNTK